MEYLDVIEKGLWYIEDHIKDHITIQDIAHSVGYSTYHFSRLFLKKTGVTIGAYVSNRKLGIASTQLIETDEKLIDISMSAGYQSYESFSRVFKSRFGIAPYFFRNKKTKHYIYSEAVLSKQMLKHFECYFSYTPEIVQIDEIQILGIPVTTTLLNNQLETYWAQLHIMRNNLLPKSNDNVECFAICTSKYAIVQENGDSSFSQFIGFKKMKHIDETSFQQEIICGGRYAVFKHNTSYKFLNLSYDFIWKIWISSSKLTFDDTRRSFELYPPQFTLEKQRPIFLYIPIK
ncbi:AraC family transcriptional regulator [Tetragenococcus koreensis]|uniref:AraC family transcriptional regulator n=1 Tax=Tetragenococcus koreensis TaxID=290335 RepID=UPI001F2BCF10|nr:AraC family transcriptional regulator [Tetragenococcus koreensis]MDN6640829.1 AraC family transcriptional regulator [Tetragenococcus sp.]MCF1584402.1 AraC family transcriptional regulator [Tetragenococcus koreensis]MCF1613951.1 AraC family transcriptional regulator [Tetragenococcus koreensis]MCF1620363.1 AraC family transcriptional regulator [Tetragenococcus koreensis]MCF1623763.1 AraC family transcriptional regulator [Tetragenococcus koreensis]